MILTSLLACIAGPAPEIRRELWRGEIDGDKVYVTAIVEDDVSTGFDPEAVPRWTLRVQVDAPWVVYALPPLASSEDAGARPTDLSPMPFVACPVPHGLAFSAQGRWFAAWRVAGGTIAMTLDDVTGEACPDVKFDAMAVARQAQDQRWCRLLDDAGDLKASAACVVNVDTRPGGGAWNPDLKVRFQTDSRHRDAFANAVVDALLAPGAAIDDLPCIHHAEAAPAVARALEERCAATTCDAAALGAAQRIVERETNLQAGPRGLPESP